MWRSHLFCLFWKRAIPFHLLFTAYIPYMSYPAAPLVYSGESTMYVEGKSDEIPCIYIPRSFHAYRSSVYYGFLNYGSSEMARKLVGKAWQAEHLIILAFTFKAEQNICNIVLNVVNCLSLGSNWVRVLAKLTRNKMPYFEPKFPKFCTLSIIQVQAFYT